MTNHDTITINVEHLISLVKERPGIWDKTAENHRNFFRRADNWSEVCSNLYPPYKQMDRKQKNSFNKQIIKRWTNLRHAWKHSIVASSKAKGSKWRVRPYKYHDQLKFLLKIFDNSDEEDNDKNDESAEDDREVLATIMWESKAHKKITMDEGEDEEEEEVDFIQKVREHEDRGRSRNAETSTQVDEEEVNITHITQAARFSIDSHALTGEDDHHKEEPSIIQFKDVKKDANKVEENQHISFIKSLLPSLNKLTDDQTLAFQLGVIKALREIRQERQSKNFYSTCFL